MMTDESRRKQIEQALKARTESAEQHTHLLPWRGSDRYFPLIDLPLDVPLLNAESHRVRAELEAKDLEFVRKERTTEQAQEALTILWKRAHRKFDKLKESLRLEGQNDPGVITRAGVLINGNTRLIALRELQDPNRLWIRVAVLESDVTPRELADLELRLQVRDPLLDEYKLSNELLFIQEMSQEFEMSDEQIAFALRFNPSKPAVGKKNVELRRNILILIREMQRRDSHLPITFFDNKLEQLKGLEKKYERLISDNEIARANLLLDTWLVAARSGSSGDHKIRTVLQCEDFIGDYLLPRLHGQEIIGEHAEALVTGKKAKGANLPGLDDLGVDVSGDPDLSNYDLKPLLRLVEKRDDKKVTFPGEGGTQFEAIQVKEAISAAVDGAIKDYRTEGKAADELNAPIEALRRAIREIEKVNTAYSELRDTKEFEHHVRGTFEYQMKTLRKRMKALENLVAGK